MCIRDRYRTPTTHHTTHCNLTSFCGLWVCESLRHDEIDSAEVFSLAVCNPLLQCVSALGSAIQCFSVSLLMSLCQDRTRDCAGGVGRSTRGRSLLKSLFAAEPHGGGSRPVSLPAVWRFVQAGKLTACNRFCEGLTAHRILRLPPDCI